MSGLSCSLRAMPRQFVIQHISFRTSVFLILMLLIPPVTSVTSPASGPSFIQSGSLVVLFLTSQ
eukprot:10530393-Alexandrium_andersonii.AAC.1